MPDIRVVDLCKSYRIGVKNPGFAGALRHLVRREHREIQAVRSVSFEVARGEVVGFLGANGAGKTTTLKMLTGLIRPTSGQAVVLGEVPFERKRKFLESITLVMGQKQQLMWDLPAIDSLNVNAAVYDIPAPEAAARIARLAELLDVSEQLRQPVRKLSLGERMKCELLAALLHQPRVLMLDEPTLGLDVNAQDAMRRFLRDYNREFGATVLLTSHYMADIVALCPRVLLIHEGQLIYDGSLSGLVDRFAPYRQVRLDLAEPVERDVLARFGEVEALDGLRAVLIVERSRLTETVARVLAELKPRDLAVSDPPVEQVVGRLFLKGAAEGRAVAASDGEGEAREPEPLS
jgi:viologen exporter family transport system ATP-binding protein